MFLFVSKANLSRTSTQNLWFLSLRKNCHFILSICIPHLCPRCLIPLSRVSLTTSQAHSLLLRFSLGPSGCQRQSLLSAVSIYTSQVDPPNLLWENHRQCLLLPKDKGSKMFSTVTRIPSVKSIWWCWMNWTLPLTTLPPTI